MHDGALSLARAFQLMSQALLELRTPVGHEPLRLRMVAMHGREDPLLEPGRFSRLLRQANDAEIADVRKLGEDEYEIAPHRTAALIGTAPAKPAAPPPPQLGTDAEAGNATPVAAGPSGSAEPAGAGRDNGVRLGLRYRRGSRGSLRPGEIPLIGVVQMEPSPAEPELEPELVAAVVAAPIAEPKKPVRRKAPRKKAAAAPAAQAAPDPEPADPAAKPKRPRARPRKKAE